MFTDFLKILETSNSYELFYLVNDVHKYLVIDLLLDEQKQIRDYTINKTQYYNLDQVVVILEGNSTCLVVKTINENQMQVPLDNVPK